MNMKTYAVISLPWFILLLLELNICFLILIIINNLNKIQLEVSVHKLCIFI